MDTIFACNITAFTGIQRERHHQLAQNLSRREGLEELTNGYALHFKYTAGLTLELAEFMTLEPLPETVNYLSWGCKSSVKMFDFDFRTPDSPHVAGVWRTRTEAGGSFMSSAASQWEIVITKQQGKTILKVRGPETKASPSPVPEDAEMFGIHFKHGSFMPQFPITGFVNQEIILPEASSQRIWLNGSAWQLPAFEDAEIFVEKMIREGLLRRDPLIQSILRGEPCDVSERTLQRRFLQVTGLTYTTIRQIERARAATALLEKGVAIAEVVHLTGYADQPHLTRAMKLLAGQTPAQLLKHA